MGFRFKGKRFLEKVNWLRSPFFEYLEILLTHSGEENLHVIVAVVIRHRAIIAAKVLTIAAMNHESGFHAITCGVLDNCVIIVLARIDFPAIVRPEDVLHLRYREGSTFNLYGLAGHPELLLR